MGLFDFNHKPDINEGVKTCAATPGAMLLDVRNSDEYALGHIPGSVNLPLPEIRTAEDRIPGPDTPLFVYCLSGARSSRAAAELQSMGYTNVHNLGGINKWSGDIEK